MTPHAEHPEPAPWERDTGVNEPHPKHKAAPRLIVVHPTYVKVDTQPPSR